MDPRIKAAMVKRGLIKQEASDDTAQAVLAAFFVQQGKPLSDKTDEVLSILLEADPKQDPQQTTSADDVDDDPPPRRRPKQGGKQAPSDDTVDAEALRQKALKEGQAKERERITNITSAGATLGIADDVVQKAIDDELSLEQAQSSFIKSLKGKETLLQKIEPGKAALDKIGEQAMGAWCERFSYIGLKSEYKGPNDLRYVSFLDVGKMYLEAAGVRTMGMLPEDVAKMALRQGSRDLTNIPRQGSQSAEPYGRPGDYANLLNNLVGKALDTSLTYKQPSYRAWCKQSESHTNFQPKQINRIGELGELSARPDGTKANQVKPSTEMNWIAVEPYAAKLGLTPRMIVDDSLGAFLEAIRGFGLAGENTMNRLAVSVLAANEPAGDGVALFHTASHKNLLASGGGVPSQAQMTKMRKMMRRQKGVSNESYTNLDVALILVAPENEDAAEQLLNPTRVAQPTTDATINTYRGRVGWEVEPMLEDYDATGLLWYAFAPAVYGGAILYAFMTGYENGKSEQWYDPETGSRWYQYETRGGVAVNNWRLAAKNPGS